MTKFLNAAKSVFGNRPVDYVTAILASTEKIGKSDRLVYFKINQVNAEAKKIVAGVQAALDAASKKASLVVISESLTPLSVGKGFFSVIAKNAVASLDYSDDSLKDKHVISANVFKDDSDNVWKLIGEGENRRLVQVSDEDQTEILKNAYNLNTRAQMASVIAQQSAINAGNFVSFYDTEKSVMASGFVSHYDYDLNKVVIVSEDLNAVGVEEDAILAAVPCPVAEKESVATAAVSDTAIEHAQSYINYLRTLYGADNSLIQGLKDLLKKKAYV